MINFFKDPKRIIAVESESDLNQTDVKKLIWLFNQAKHLDKKHLSGYYIGPRKEMVTPWSTNAIEIAENTGITGLIRMEEFIPAEKDTPFDPMIQHLYQGLDQELFTINREPEDIIYVNDIGEYNKSEGLALSNEEVRYLETISTKLKRKLTDSEVFGFSQVNSEHCRHKIFNGKFIIDGLEMRSSLFSLIKKTSMINQGNLISAYKDNVAFIKGSSAGIFAPQQQDKATWFETRKTDTVISLKAETHNFPTTVEPFSGAATGSGGEIRDRMAGGKASMPLAGTAVYMTPYPRNEKGKKHEEAIEARKWLYHDPKSILIKASNGASDYGNKFGQPLICGSLLTFEHQENKKTFAYDKVVMLAGGTGYAKKQDSEKEKPIKGDLILVMGGDNYRIGMGGSSVSSVATGEYGNNLELNAVQRSNPEMQKRVYNTIRAMAEANINSVVAIHDHGAGGHLNSLSELVEEVGGVIDVDKLPVGDKTLSVKEIIGNESQERMGLIIKKEDLAKIEAIAERERAPLYVVGEVTGDHKFIVRDNRTGEKPIDLDIKDMFGKPPKTTLKDKSYSLKYKAVKYDQSKFREYLERVLQLESVACKDWLTNKVDRSVTGRIALQQNTGPLQIPLNNLGITTLDYRGDKGIATAIGHAPAVGLINPEKGSKLSIAEALTNIVWAPIKGGLKNISLSANWMWPANNEGENSRLYRAVEAASNFAIDLGLNIPTGKDSLSMKQKYPDGKEVLSPGTVIITAVGQTDKIEKAVEPALKPIPETKILYVDFSKDLPNLGGSSFAQTLNYLGDSAPTVEDALYFKRAFDCIQEMLRNDIILAGHDISAGGLITALLEMTFAQPKVGINANTSGLYSEDPVLSLFNEKPGVLIQVENNYEAKRLLNKMSVSFVEIGQVNFTRTLNLKHHNNNYELDIDHLLKTWFKTSWLMDKDQSGEYLAKARYDNINKHPLSFRYSQNFSGKLKNLNIRPERNKPSGIKAAIIREKGVNGDREMAYAMYLAGFDVKDIHMTDLAKGNEDLEDISFIVFVGGFSNSDVLGSAKGWAGAFRYNEKARKALDSFYSRKDTLSLGVCNGCQLMNELELLYPDHNQHPKNKHNLSGKFESGFINVEIPENNNIMLKSLVGSKLGIWIAHGEGKLELPLEEEHYHIPMKYSSSDYPVNPNGTKYNAAALSSMDGRHLAMMPHLERSILPWQWAFYPDEHKDHQITPWMEAFSNALTWIEKQNS
ncbi:MAG: phosphoribosylformylglycinamidine synthase [Bacteroidales bacterium]|nr:phosphoribosylformylglycinamidine synthase [Bacteroidales bacterium]